MNPVRHLRSFKPPTPSSPGSPSTAPAWGLASGTAMAGAMKTLLFWVAFFVVAMAAVVVHAHNGVDHGPAAAPHSEESSAATLMASWMTPLALLVAVAAFAQVRL